MTPFRFPENVFFFFKVWVMVRVMVRVMVKAIISVRGRVEIRVRVSGNSFSVKRPFGQVS